MKKVTLLVVTFTATMLFSLQTVSAQLPIKIPKISKPKPESAQPAPSTTTQPSQPESRNETKPSTATASEAQMRIAKDSIQVTAAPKHGYRGDSDTWAWVPRVTFQINGPIPSGSLFAVEFTIPGSGPWLKLNCVNREGERGVWLKTECGEDIPDDKGSIYTGTVNFTISMRNELRGTDSTVFNGSAKVGKTQTNLPGSNAAKKFSYYIDDDWNLPIGYLYYQGGYEDAGLEHPTLSFAFWARGYPYIDFTPYLFRNGNEVDARGVCTDEVVNNPSNDTAAKDRFTWRREGCNFAAVTVWDKETGMHPRPRYLLVENPGDYEIKILYKGQLVRSAKFTVNAGGIVDNGLATVNKLGSNRFIVPVTVIGDQDGQWDRIAWKSGAFYGNPLTGFTPLP